LIDFQKIPKCKNAMKIHPVGAELFHVGRPTDRQTDRHTDMTDLRVAFHNFAKDPQKERQHCVRTTYAWEESYTSSTALHREEQ
jgi:hypothetical protein